MKKLEVDMGVEINIGVEKGFPFPSKTASEKMCFWDRTPIPNLRPTEIAYLELLRLPHTDEWRALNQDIFARLREEIADNWQWDSEKVQNHFEDMAYPETRPSEAWETDAAECALATFKKEMAAQDKEQPDVCSRCGKSEGLVPYYYTLSSGETKSVRVCYCSRDAEPELPKRESIALTTKQANDLIVVWKLLQKVATVESAGEGKLIVEHASMRMDGQQALAYLEPIIAKIQHMSKEIEDQEGK